MLYLEGSDGSRLEPEISLEVLGDLPDEALEGQLADQELGGLLVPPDLTEGHCAGPVPVIREKKRKLETERGKKGRKKERKKKGNTVGDIQKPDQQIIRTKLN